MPMLRVRGVRGFALDVGKCSNSQTIDDEWYTADYDFWCLVLGIFTATLGQLPFWFSIAEPGVMIIKCPADWYLQS